MRRQRWFRDKEKRQSCAVWELYRTIKTTRAGSAKSKEKMRDTQLCWATYQSFFFLFQLFSLPFPLLKASFVIMQKNGLNFCHGNMFWVTTRTKILLASLFIIYSIFISLICSSRHSLNKYILMALSTLTNLLFV